MASRGFGLCLTRDERHSSSPPARSRQLQSPPLSRTTSHQGSFPMTPLEPKVVQYGQDKAKKRRASDSAYVTKSAGYWSKTDEGKAALERYREETKKYQDKRKQGVQSRRGFCQVALRSHSIPLPPHSPLDGPSGYQERARRRIFTAGVESFDRELFPSLAGENLNDSEVLANEQRIEGRLENVRKQVEIDERAFHEKVADEFEWGVIHHTKNFDKDIDQLKRCLYEFYPEFLASEGGPTSEKANDSIVLAACRAFELDIVLLTKYWFVKRTNEIQQGPIGGQDEKAIIRAFEFAEFQAHREVTNDDLQHSCNPHCDDLHPATRCPACLQHALHLYESRNDEVHQEVLRLGLYRIGKNPDSTARNLNAHYYFIAFACLISKVRQGHQQDPNSHVRKDARDRMFLLLDDYYKHCMKETPSSLQQAHEIFFRLESIWDRTHHADIVKKLQEFQQQQVLNKTSQPNPPAPLRSPPPPPPEPTLHPRSLSHSSLRPQTAPEPSHSPPRNGEINRFRGRQNSVPTLNRSQTHPASGTPDISSLFDGLSTVRLSPKRSRFRRAFELLPQIDTAPPSPADSDHEDEQFSDSAYVSATAPLPPLNQLNSHQSPIAPNPPRLETPSFGGSDFYHHPNRSNESAHSLNSAHSLDSVGEVRDQRGRVSRRPVVVARDFCYSPGRRGERRSVSVHRA